jgi:transposase-like protein
MMSLRTLLEKSADANLLRAMMGFAAQRLMELEVEGLTGAAHGERSPDRINQRNGGRDRTWEARAGRRRDAHPKAATSRVFWSPRRMAEKALVAVIQEAYVQGMSTRSIDKLVRAMGMTGGMCGSIGPERPSLSSPGFWSHVSMPPPRIVCWSRMALDQMRRCGER